MGILGSIGTAIFGGMKKRSKTKFNTAQESAPYGPTIPYLDEYLKNTGALYGGGAPQISPYEQQGYDLLQKTVGGPGAIKPAMTANAETLSGKFLNPSSNPYISAIAQRAAGMAGSDAFSTFSGAGRTGSGLAGYYAGRGAAEAANDVFYQNYSDERSRQLQAAGQAAQLEAARYLGPQAMISAGQNISARPFDINQQYGSILSRIAQLGGTQTARGNSTTYGSTGGLLGKIADAFTGALLGPAGAGTGAMNSFSNKLFAG